MKIAKISIVFCAIILLISTLLSAKKVLASSNLKVEGAIINAEVLPGESIKHRIKVSVAEDSSDCDVEVTVGGMSQSIEGFVEFRNLSSQNEDFSAAGYIEVDKKSFHLKPGSSEELNVNINIPENAGGGKYAVINIQSKPLDQSSVGVQTAINVPVYLKIKNNLNVSGKIIEIKTGDISDTRPIEIYTIFQNTGNVHYKTQCQISVTDISGKEIDKLFTTAGSYIIPGSLREIKTLFIPEEKLAIGTYLIKARLTLDDGSLLDEAEGAFEVKAPYVPPPPPASAVLKPAQAVSLHTDDGRIFIDFPRSAVLGETTVSLRSYPPEQVPAPPPGYQMGVTCFRVDGLTGLLAKEAKITVKYSSADLEKAGGEAKRLRLARWDEAEGSWTILKTAVDQGTQTLTASTNRFSIWAVMADARPSSGFNWRLLSTIGLIVVLVVIGVLLVTGRKKKQN